MSEDEKAPFIRENQKMKEKYEMYEQHLARFREQEGHLLEDDQIDLEE